MSKTETIVTTVKKTENVITMTVREFMHKFNIPANVLIRIEQDNNAGGYLFIGRDSEAELAISWEEEETLETQKTVG